MFLGQEIEDDVGNNSRCSHKTTKEKKDRKASTAVLTIFSLEKLRQEDYKFKVSLGSIGRHLVKKKTPIC